MDKKYVISIDINSGLNSLNGLSSNALKADLVLACGIYKYGHFLNMAKDYIKELNKVFTAEDCGGGIKGNKIDIYMNSQSACNNWGVRTITLQILK